MGHYWVSWFYSHELSSHFIQANLAEVTFRINGIEKADFQFLCDRRHILKCWIVFRLNLVWRSGAGWGRFTNRLSTSTSFLPEWPKIRAAATPWSGRPSAASSPSSSTTSSSETGQVFGQLLFTVGHHRRNYAAVYDRTRAHWANCSTARVIQSQNFLPIALKKLFSTSESSDLVKYCPMSRHS